MRNIIIRIVFLFLIAILSIQIYSYSQDINPYDYYKGGKKNLIYTDVTYLIKPFYVLGYERKINSKYSVSTGVLILNNAEAYKIPFTEVEFGDLALFYSTKSKLNFFLIGIYDFTANRSFLRNSISAGYQLVNSDDVRMNDFFVRKSVISITAWDRFYFSLNVQVGLRCVKVRNPVYVFYMQQVIERVFTVNVHLPFVIGFKF